MAKQAMPERVFLLGAKRASKEESGTQLEIATIMLTGQELFPVFTTAEKAEYFASHAQEFGINLCEFKVYEVFLNQIDRPVALDLLPSAVAGGKLQPIK